MSIQSPNLRVSTGGRQVASVGPIATEKKILVFKGENGIGKSSLFKAVLGFPSFRLSGELKVDDVSIRTCRRRGSIGYLPQTLSGDPLVQLRTFSTLVDEEGANLIKNLPQGCSMNELSVGQLKLASCSYLLARRSKLLLLDEPFDGLSAPLRGALLAHIKNLVQGNSLLVFLIDHTAMWRQLGKLVDSIELRDVED